MTKAPNVIDILRDELGTARNDEKAAQKQLIEMQRALRSLDARLKYDPDNADLRAEREGLVSALGEKEVVITELTDARTEAAARFQQEQVRIAQTEVIERSHDYSFSVPLDNPVVACQLLSSIASSLQYQFCASRSYYEYLLAETGRTFGQDQGGSIDDRATTEINTGLQDQLDEIRERRAYLQALRYAAERAFKEASEDVPADAQFKPTLLRRSDAEVYRQLDERQEQRLEEARERREKTRQQVQNFGRDVEDQAYVPGTV